MNSISGERSRQERCIASEWSNLIPVNQWQTYFEAIQVIRAAGLRFMLGGAFGLAAYTGHWRNTKDIDFFVLPSDRPRAVDALTQAGFTDYYETTPYDRGWIYRATRSGLIVDIIWATPNRRTEVDELWFENSRRVTIHSEVLEVVPAEELVWIKLYVLQRDRCDWPDVINLLYCTSKVIHWKRLVDRLEGDLPLLAGLLTVFAWLCPDRMGDIPAELRKRLRLPPREALSGPDTHRIQLLDTRAWFAALQPTDRPMGV